MNQPTVSVAMVVCNVERFLGEAIESILSQTFHDFEFIIVDFGSTDRSKAIVSSYAKNDDRIKLHEIPHCGLAEARNAAAFLANGRYIAIQDADDMSLPDRLSVEVQFLDSHPGVGVVGSATQWVDVAANPLWVHRVPTQDREIRNALLTRCPFVQSSVLIRRESFAKVAGYRAPFAPAEDYDLWLRISEHFACANIDQVLLKYRIHPYQLSLRDRRQQSIGFLAAQASAEFRKTTNSDPLNSVKKITPDVLTEIGLSEAKQQTALFADYRDWVRNMFIAGEYSVALRAATEVLQSKWEAVDTSRIADLQLMIARLHWKQRQYPKSVAAASKAVTARPQLLGDLFSTFFQKLGLAHRRGNSIPSRPAAPTV
jgi:glycosyltransferase involved in cell wall biosynthesis